MSKKSCPFLYSECTLKIGQGFVDMQYSYIRLDVPLVWGPASDPPLGRLPAAANEGIDAIYTLQ